MSRQFLITILSTKYAYNQQKCFNQLCIYTFFLNSGGILFTSRFFILFTTIVLVAGAIQGIASYVDYCNDDDDDDDDDDFQQCTYSDHYNRCDFINRGKYAPDVDFIAVIAFSGPEELVFALGK